MTRRRSAKLTLPWHGRGTVGALLAACAVGLALLTQVDLDRHPGAWFDGLVLFGLAAALWWRSLADEPARENAPEAGGAAPPMTERRRMALIVGLTLVLITGVLAPLAARFLPTALADMLGPLALVRYPDGIGVATNTFGVLGGPLWLLGVVLSVVGLAELGGMRARVVRLWDGDNLRVSIGRVGLAVLAITALAAWLRFRDLVNVPWEMTSDHTEKLLDIRDMLGGLRPVYLPRNAGREPLEFYLAAALVALGMPLRFITLKAAMGLVSTLTVPVTYLLGKRVVGREVGLLAALVLALSPWHIQITRIGLRIAWSPLFAAITLVFLYDVLRRGARNDWLALGIGVGAGMYGYSGFRPMAFVVALAVGGKLACDMWRARSERSVGVTARAPGDGPEPVAAGVDDDLGGDVPQGAAGNAGRALRRVAQPLEEAALSLGVALLVAAPLVRFALDQPASFWGRTLTRATGAEVALRNPAWRQLLVNWKQALLMFNLTSDSAWFQSPPGRPALETVTGALFVLGVATALYRARRGSWREALLLVAVPIMLVASVLALAFPDEVPHLSRAAGALPAVAVLVVLPLPVVAGQWRRSLGGDRGSLAYLALLCLLFVWCGRNTWQRYFVEYRTAYDQATHPTVEGAAIARGFMAMGGRADQVYLVGWPHGWDYRAIGAEIGDLDWNGLLWGAAADASDAVTLAENHVADPGPKLYFVSGARASENVDFLRQLFPGAVVAEHPSSRTGKPFWTVFVPSGRSEAQP